MNVYAAIILAALLADLVLHVAADRFAVRATADAEALAGALKTLSVENLANLSPHPATVFLNYSHPPVMARLESIRRAAF